jgi:hypothetical protein
VAFSPCNIMFVEPREEKHLRSMWYHALSHPRGT